MCVTSCACVHAYREGGFVGATAGISSLDMCLVGVCVRARVRACSCVPRREASLFLSEIYFSSYFDVVIKRAGKIVADDRVQYRAVACRAVHYTQQIG